MRKLTPILFAGWTLASVVQTEGQSAPAAVPASTTNAAPAALAPAAVPLADVVTVAVDDSNRLQEIETSLANDHLVAETDRILPVMAKEVDQKKSDDDKLFASSPSLPTLRTAHTTWQMVAESLNGPKISLANRISQLDTDESDLGKMRDKWQATLLTAKTSAVPADVLSRINNILATVARTTKEVDALRAKMLSRQSSVALEASRVAAEQSSIEKMQSSAVFLLFVQDSPPIWNVSQPAAGPRSGGLGPFSDQVKALRSYVADKLPTTFIHLGIFILLALGLFWVRRKTDTGDAKQPGMQAPLQVLRMPMAVAAVLALLLSWWLYPLAPRLFEAGLGAAALIPTVIILRRLIEPSLFPILYALVLFYAIDQVRFVAASQPLLGRSIFLFQMVVVLVFLIWLLRSTRLSQMGRPRLETFIRCYLGVALLVIFASALANALGYTHLSYQTGNAMLESSYLAVILYAAVRIADGLVLALLEVKPFSGLGMVQRHSQLLAGNVSRVCRWIAFLFWLWEALDLFSLRAPLWTRGTAWLTTAGPSSTIQPSFFGRLILFVLAIWATFLVSRFLRFCLAEEVYPHVKLGPGVAYAASTMVHYAVLIIGALVALNILGIDLSKYSVLVGALGVGLGFGLQNIMNNFVSGLILLFERPIKVGDVIQVDTAMGTVESIGIRASVIRITNGSEIIMPNGNLISNQVTNWTFSDRQRAIDLPVVVAAKADAKKVMALLIETVKANPQVLKNPPPQVLLTNFSAASLNFELRAWTAGQESWSQTRSELSLAVAEALSRENVAVS